MATDFDANVRDAEQLLGRFRSQTLPHFINGRHDEGRSGKTFESTTPIDNSVIGTVAAGTVHALQAGSDVDNPMTWAIAGAGSIAIVLLGVVRLGRGSAPRPQRPTSETEILEEMRQLLAHPVMGTPPTDLGQAG